MILILIFPLRRSSKRSRRSSKSTIRTAVGTAVNMGRAIRCTAAAMATTRATPAAVQRYTRIGLIDIELWQ